MTLTHHGSGTLSERFSDSVDAQIAMISVGAENDYGHPHPRALAAYADSYIARTDVMGSFSVSGYGADLRVHTERNET